MNIQLNEWKVNSVEFRMEDTQLPNGFKLETELKYPKDEPLRFFVVFKLGLMNKDFMLNIKASYGFTLDQEVTDEFKESNLATISAPAIAYPFLRAFVSNLTLQSGVTPIILPSRNFANDR